MRNDINDIMKISSLHGESPSGVYDIVLTKDGAISYFKPSLPSKGWPPIPYGFKWEREPDDGLGQICSGTVPLPSLWDQVTNGFETILGYFMTQHTALTLVVVMVVFLLAIVAVMTIIPSQRLKVGATDLENGLCLLKRGDRDKDKKGGVHSTLDREMKVRQPKPRGHISIDLCLGAPK